MSWNWCEMGSNVEIGILLFSIVSTIELYLNGTHFFFLRSDMKCSFHMCTRKITEEIWTFSNQDIEHAQSYLACILVFYLIFNDAFTLSVSFGINWALSLLCLGLCSIQIASKKATACTLYNLISCCWVSTFTSVL